MKHQRFYHKGQIENNRAANQLKGLKSQFVQLIEQLSEVKAEFKLLRDRKKRLFNSRTWHWVRTISSLFSPFGIDKKLDQRVEELNESISTVNQNIRSLLNSLRDFNQELIELGNSKNLHIIDPSLIDFEKVTALTLPQHTNPDVSIIIPAYNQASHTYATILSVLNHTEQDCTYEIILIDDCSSQKVAREMPFFFQNLVYIQNEENLGFLENCNKAASHAKGKNILFLNNDTNVQPGWLSSLVKVFREDSEVGMVGSRLVYPSGLQQEAGGIVWSDASGWNFGKMEDPDHYEYNYLKEVDYVSGASLLIKKTIWDEIGGFDKRYIPAYFEDTDLAFQVRERGLKVMYQPDSWVVHFEGISHGTNESSGIKEYQKKNREKFKAKWSNQLQRHFTNGENVFLAKDRGQFKKTILVIDHYIPRFDQDAGSRSTFSYLKLFSEEGLNVKFLGDNFFHDVAYAHVLEQLGIEVMYGPKIRANIESWFEKNGQHLDYVFINRPHIAEKYLPLVKQYTDAKLLYYGHDLHFLRESREHELTGDLSKIESSESWEMIEFNILKNVDLSLFPSNVEVDLIKSKDSAIAVSQIPVILFDEFAACRRDSKTTGNLMFCGGFKHPPNVDGVIWFVKTIWPLITTAIPDIKFFIIGSHPPEEIMELQNDNIIVTGFISDEELEEYYKTCRITVAPLRFGAGIKGKIVEALYHQIPIVTTTIGAEGLTDIESFVGVHDDPSKFANHVIRLYKDENIDDVGAQGLAYCERYFSKEAAKIALMDHITF